MLLSPLMTTTTDFETVTQWYEHCSENYQDLYDTIVDHISWADKWNVEQVIEFIEKLRDIGIYNAKSFDQFYFGSYDTLYPEADFTEDYYQESEIIDQDNPLFNFVDWQRVWDGHLSSYYTTFKFDNDTFFFHEI